MFQIDSRAFVASMKHARKQLPLLVARGLADTARDAAHFAASSGEFRSRTGNLRRKILPKLLSRTHSRTTADTPYSAYVENGNTFRNGAQWIYPKNGKFLKFTIDGETIFARRVKASKPRFFMREAQRKVEPIFDRRMRSSVDGMFG